MKVLLSKIVFAFVALNCISSAQAIPITWNLQNATLTGGITASGSFVYDADLNQFSDIFLTTDLGIEYSTLRGGRSDFVFFAEERVAADEDGLFVFPILLLANMTNAGGTIDIATGTLFSGLGTCDGATCPIVGFRHFFETGQITTTINEPASALAFLLLGSGLMMRRRYQAKTKLLPGA